ncbi:MAG TPA: hypothetical protein DCF44_02915 [Chitinophagaceae bacterium]|nr:hypothetical protein [Chitinophagaceae bacterium]
MSAYIYLAKIAQIFRLSRFSIYFSFVSLLFCPSVGKKLALLVFRVWLVGRQNPNVLICALAFSASALTCLFALLHSGLHAIFDCKVLLFNVYFSHLKTIQTNYISIHGKP